MFTEAIFIPINGLVRLGFFLASRAIEERAHCLGEASFPTVYDPTQFLVLRLR